MTPGHAGHELRCMEIRGGSHAVEEAFSTPGLDGWVRSAPFEGAESGGDLYYLSVCGGGETTRLIVADVSGHGAKVAGFAAALRGLMRKNINTKSQTRLVRALNREFGAATELEKFATAVVVTYLASRRTLTVCNAGHPHPLWYRAARRSWAVLDREAEGVGNLPLGIDDESAYNQFAVPFGPGDLMLFYTDALCEAADPAGRMLGEDGLLGLAKGLDVTDPGLVGPALLDGVDRHLGGNPINDDLTLVTLRHTATGPKPPTAVEKLGVYAKVFGLKAV